ncbi:hypothetical protein DFJ58DRAFT_724575 [Suillus subalutaceus]|uniref:uncharacterized protein n=1 Tax=Suillus subalutaceus TaxID=48586 RepID=UPI001B88155C|nr:uncharacterized protein DFJ58DRAFT_724575 [Suillus subalutaceus]KAG1865020.1 hypothetical protein DFJ58DRAFT_724575 [Suillus subalutaceus]
MSVPARPSCHKFTGMQDASEWMEDFSCALDAASIAIASCHICFSRSLTGTALQWFFDLPYNEKLSWQKLKSAFLTRWSRNFPHTTPAVIATPLNTSSSVYSEHSTQDLTREQKAALIQAGTMVAPIHLYRDHSFQTTSVAVKTYITCSTQTETLYTVSPRPAPTNGTSPAQSFNWADDVDSTVLSTFPTQPTLPSQQPYKFSVLWSSNTNPWSSLQCHHCRSSDQCSHSFPQRAQPQPDFELPKVALAVAASDNMLIKPSVNFTAASATVDFVASPPCPALEIPGAQTHIVSLDWEQDPRLRDLSCAL